MTRMPGNTGPVQRPIARPPAAPPAPAGSLATLDQRRARHSWHAVKAVVDVHAPAVNGKRVPDKAGKKYATQAKKLPTRIMTAGLGQALAFLKAKDYAPDLMKALGDWVLDKRDNPASTAPPPADDALLQAVVNGNSDFLRRATDEALAYLTWLNRWVDAEFGEVISEDN